MKRIQLLARGSRGVGLDRDLAILGDALGAAGFDVTTTIVPVGKEDETPPRARPGGHAAPPFDVNLMLESVLSAWLPTARTNGLLPNPEWLRERFAGLEDVDWVLCKTRDAEQIFSRYGCRTAFTSFTSLDRLDEAIERSAEGCFHLAGASRQKGTAALLELWGTRSDWPQLELLQHRGQTPVPSAANVHAVESYVPDAQLRVWQNRFGIHLCPSEAEGFGHSLVEGMSCGALVVTTDAPPMNELVQETRGLLARARAGARQRFGTRHPADPGALEGTIDRALGMTYAERNALGSNARQWFLDNDRFFRTRIAEVVADL